MNVASLELCRELYKLSGWEPELATVKELNIFGEVRNDYTDLWVNRSTSTAVEYHPAYDLGYLLRKLSGNAEVGVKWLKTDFYLAKTGYEYSFNRATAETPEDAACKLATELFKKGVLKREDLHGEK